MSAHRPEEGQKRGPRGPPCPAPQSAGARAGPRLHGPWRWHLQPGGGLGMRGSSVCTHRGGSETSALSCQAPPVQPLPPPPPPCLGPARAASALWWRRGRPGGAGSGPGAGSPGCGRRAWGTMASGTSCAERLPATGTHSGRVTAAGRSAHPTGGRGVGAGAGLGAREAREPQGSQGHCPGAEEPGVFRNRCALLRGEPCGDQGPTPPWAGALAPRVDGAAAGGRGDRAGQARSGRTEGPGSLAEPCAQSAHAGPCGGNLGPSWDRPSSTRPVS